MNENIGILAKVGVKLLSKSARLPKQATPGSICLDLYADDDTVLFQGYHTSIGTGLAFELPENIGARIYPRSGKSREFPNYVANSVGMIDSDYRGEIRILVVNNTGLPMSIAKGERIAQVEFFEKPKFTVVFEVVDELSATLRGDGGFGSTGVA